MLSKVNEISIYLGEHSMFRASVVLLRVDVVINQKRPCGVLGQSHVSDHVHFAQALWFRCTALQFTHSHTVPRVRKNYPNRNKQSPDRNCRNQFNRLAGG